MREGLCANPRASSAEAIVFVVDDDPDVRSALSRLFRSVGMSAEVFASPTELLQYQRPLIPSCLVLDMRLPRLSGFDLQAELNRLGIDMPIIFVTAHGDIPMSVQAMKTGAVDFLTKPFRDQELLDAVTRALDRDRKRRTEEIAQSQVRARFALLTLRERQIMALVTGGLLNKQIAGKLGISEMTVKIHRGSVMRKMEAKSLADLVLTAEKLGIRGRDDL